MGDYVGIHSIEVELSGYRKGSLSVFIDLEKGYLTWRESTRWCNNFTRTITAEQVKAIRGDLEDCNLFNWQNLPAEKASDSDPEGQHPSRFAWQVKVLYDGESWVREGENRLPGQWAAFCAAIERLSRTKFRL